MKTLFSYLFFAAVALGTSHVSNAETKSIDFPYFKANNSRALEIRRVESGADTTYVFADIYSRPDVWASIGGTSYIKGDKSGKICRLIGIDGMEPDTEVYPGDDWHIPFVMKFEALDDGDTGFDYIENDAPGSFKITGVSLDDALSSGSVTCRLEGTVSNPAFTRLILSEFDVDFRTGQTYSIPVDSGLFVYDFHCEPDMMYSLVPFNEYMSGAWTQCYFFTCDGTVRFDIQDEERIVTSETEEQKQADGYKEFMMQWQDEHLRDYNEMLQNMKREEFYTPAYGIMIEKIRNAEGKERIALQRNFNSADYLTEKGKAVKAMGDSLMSAFHTECVAYLSQHPSLFGLKYVLDELQYSKYEDEVLDVIDLYEKNLKNYRPEHPYHEKVSTAVAAYRLKPGKKYIDYELSDGKGGKVKISDLIGGHLTLIDLWASWCGPCRVNSKSIIPVYEKYKDRGFKVIGIAREAQAENMQAAIEQDGYPWPNYLELNDENQIWSLNGLGNAGGGTFLIDGDGTVIMVNPTAEDIVIVLETELNKK
ncbi:MAG: TlpA family protein disulfide reductase [Muribaculaceae bacterium]|nr:TlpA family protein disulfide reductase [Muribaculaceae bacterium]